MVSSASLSSFLTSDILNAVLFFGHEMFNMHPYQFDRVQFSLPSWGTWNGMFPLPFNLFRFVDDIRLISLDNFMQFRFVHAVFEFYVTLFQPAKHICFKSGVGGTVCGICGSIMVACIIEYYAAWPRHKRSKYSSNILCSSPGGNPLFSCPQKQDPCQ